MTDDCEITSDDAPNEDVEDDNTTVMVERDVVDFWQFTEYARLSIGDDEYKSDPDFWTAHFQRDYETIKERLEIERKMISGEIEMTDFEDDLTPHQFVWEKVCGLRLLSLDQFILECNQGIFREDRFYCDKGRAWMKKVAKTLDAYGFPYVRKVEVEGKLLLEVSKSPMGVV